ncbi:MAG: ribosome maturation factor RimM [Bacteroidetes bacterium]|nr:ribosome maturation factor RimM [Bacteroidota bacterium]
MDLIAIGKILKPVGTRGAMKIEALTCAPERFHELRRVWIGFTPDCVRECYVRSVDVREKCVVLTVESVESVEQVDALRSGYIFIRQEERIRIPEGTYFIDELIGCSVFDEANTFIGTLHDVLQMPAHDVWIVKMETREIMVPAVKAFIRAVDVSNKRIVLHVIEGLLE